MKRILIAFSYGVYDECHCVNGRVFYEISEKEFGLLGIISDIIYFNELWDEYAVNWKCNDMYHWGVWKKVKYLDDMLGRI